MIQRMTFRLNNIIDGQKLFGLCQSDEKRYDYVCKT